VDGLGSQAASRGADVQLLGLSTSVDGTRCRFTLGLLARKQESRGKTSLCGVDRAVRAMEGASDHAPVWIDLAT